MFFSLKEKKRKEKKRKKKKRKEKKKKEKKRKEKKRKIEYYNTILNICPIATMDFSDSLTNGYARMQNKLQGYLVYYTAKKAEASAKLTTATLELDVDAITAANEAIKTAERYMHLAESDLCDLSFARNLVNGPA